jgi:hypothetical protein
MFELASSTNTSWDYDNFWETDGSSQIKPRGAHFSPAKIGDEIAATKLGIDFYYESMTASDPDTQTTAVSTTASVLGSFTLAGDTHSGTGILLPYVVGDDAITHLTVSGNKWYEAGADWFDTLTWQESYTGGSGDIFGEGAPAVAGVVEAWNQNNVALTNNNLHVSSRCQRSSSTGEARLEVSDCTVTIDSNTVPVHAIQSETECYHINLVLTNTTTDEYMTISYRIPVGDSLEIDTKNKTVTWVEENANARGGVGFDRIRYDWLQLQPGGNTLQYAETGAADIDLTIEWQDRSS